MLFGFSISFCFKCFELVRNIGSTSDDIKIHLAFTSLNQEVWNLIFFIIFSFSLDNFLLKWVLSFNFYFLKISVAFCCTFININYLAHQEMERSGCQAFDCKNLAETFKCQGNKIFVCLLFCWQLVL